MLQVFFVLLFIFFFSGGREELISRLSDEAQVRVTLASSAFRSITEKFLSGEIQMKTLDKILESRQEFMDFLKIGEYIYLFSFAPLTNLSPFFQKVLFSLHEIQLQEK